VGIGIVEDTGGQQQVRTREAHGRDGRQFCVVGLKQLGALAGPGSSERMTRENWICKTTLDQRERERETRTHTHTHTHTHTALSPPLPRRAQSQECAWPRPHPRGRCGPPVRPSPSEAVEWVRTERENGGRESESEKEREKEKERENTCLLG
jgi:hypothetical protein